MLGGGSWYRGGFLGRRWEGVVGIGVSRWWEGVSSLLSRYRDHFSRKRILHSRT